MDEPTVDYWTNAPDDAYPTSMRLAPDERVHVEVTSNAPDPVAHAIGHFEMRADVRGASALRSAIRDPAFAAHRNPTEIQPGEVVRRITVTHADGSVLDRIASEGQTTSAAFSRVETAARALVDAARASPRFALGMRVELGHSTQRTHVGGRIVLFNPGPTTIAVPEPARWEALGVEGTVLARRNDVPVATMSDQDQVFVPLTAAAVRAGADTRIVLEAGADRVIPFSVDIPRPPGRYDIFVSFALVVFSEAGETLLRGELTTNALALPG